MTNVTFDTFVNNVTANYSSGSMPTNDTNHTQTHLHTRRVLQEIEQFSTHQLTNKNKSTKSPDTESLRITPTNPLHSNCKISNLRITNACESRGETWNENIQHFQVSSCLFLRMCPSHDWIRAHVFLRVAMLMICKKIWGSPEVFHLMLGGLGQPSEEIENPPKELRSYLPTHKLYDKGIFPPGLYYECKPLNRIIIPKVTGEEWKRGQNLSSIGAFSNERSNEHSEKNTNSTT